MKGAKNGVGEGVGGCGVRIGRGNEIGSRRRSGRRSGGGGGEEEEWEKEWEKAEV